MARIRHSSGHYDGPGDAPPPRGVRRKRQSRTPSTDLTNRNLNSPHEATSSSSPSPTDGVQHSPKKRVKRTIVDDSTQLNQELQNAVLHYDQPDTIQVVINKTAGKRTRFSDPGPSVEPDSTTPATTPRNLPSSGLTPHLNRTTLAQPTKSGRNSRFSLPAQLHNSQPGAGNAARELQFVPLRAILDDRMKRRLRRSHLSEEVNEIEEHNKEDIRTRHEVEHLRRQVREKDERVKELMLEAEIQRQMGIDISGNNDKVKQMEDELSRLRKEISDHKTQSIFSGSERGDSADVDMDDDDNHDVVLVDPEDINVSQEDMHATPHVNGFYSSQSSMSKHTSSQSLSEAATQASLPDSAHEADIMRFEGAIASLAREAADAKAALQILSIELQGLGFADPEAGSDVVLQAIRTSFREARAQLEYLLPSGTPTNLENGELLATLTNHIKGLMAELKENTALVEQHNQMEKVLQTQNTGLIDKLAEVDARKTALEQQWHTLDIQNEERQRTIIELEDELAVMHGAMDERDKDITEMDAKIDGLEEEVSNQNVSIERLQKALEGYRNEVASLEGLVTRMEQEHEAKIAQMEEDYANQIADLESRLRAEAEARETAETDAEQKLAFINGLEAKINAAEKDLEDLRAQVSRIDTLAQAEKAQRETTEAELDQKTASIANLEIKIEHAEESLKNLNAELDSLRSLADSEHRQREAAEATLDERNGKIAELESKIRDAGIQANELRSKLFQVQMEKESSNKQLNEEAEARNAQFEKDIEAEAARRQAVEAESAARNVTIAELELELAKTEQKLERMVEEKNALVESTDAEIARLETALETIRQEYEELSQDASSQISSLRSDIVDLAQAITDRDTTIETLQNEAATTASAHQAATAKQDSTIAGLTDDLASAHTQIEQLTAQKSSLEHRVEAEATELLNIVNAHADEVSSLRSLIASRESEIASLTQTGHDRDAEYAAVLAQKNREIDAMRLVADARAVDIAALSARLEELKAKFRARADDGRDTAEAMAKDMRAMMERAEARAAGLGQRSGEALREVEDIKVEGVTLHLVNGGDMHRVMDGRVAKVKDRVRVVNMKSGHGRRKFDSGIGVDESEDEVDGVVSDMVAV